jgi:hypothetical protein
MLKFKLKYLIIAPKYFGPLGPSCVLSAVQRETHAARHSVHTQHCKTYDDVFLLINYTKL